MTKIKSTSPVVLSFGGGTNSAAMLVGLHERNESVDLILFADTGGEKPHTYTFINQMNVWLKSIGFPEITVVRKLRKTGEWESLEAECLRRSVLPAIAYGWKTCSQKFKILPQDKFLDRWEPAKDVWAQGGKVTKLIGYDAGEPQRAKDYTTEKYDLQYPLIEWGWGREECEEAILRAGLPLPGKSSCFFCPYNRKEEILQLQKEYPEHLDRALAIEDKAKPALVKIKGLGRRFSWREFLEGQVVSEVSTDMPCGCYDGGSE